MHWLAAAVWERSNAFQSCMWIQLCLIIYLFIFGIGGFPVFIVFVCLCVWCRNINRELRLGPSTLMSHSVWKDGSRGDEKVLQCVYHVYIYVFHSEDLGGFCVWFITCRGIFAVPAVQHCGGNKATDHVCFAAFMCIHSLSTSASYVYCCVFVSFLFQ